ncbi:uncharacterized protein LOC133777490 isoform X2 [Humulus lupulus]|uniref:uncharacterized protein LOC133777490 isoform X2 n=1 Tax=Humulus lupulus TaxID=3486 RepID=UPI002B40136D|nr:uncharacterized protein LOC133777490 isoform X2 [Humulus lupulus]
MDRTAFLTVLFFLLVVSDVSNASLLLNLRKFVTTARDSIPGTPAPIPALVTGDKNVDPETLNTGNKENKLDPNSTSKGDEGKELIPKLGKEENKKKQIDQKVPNAIIKGSKSDQKPVNEAGKDSTLESKSENVTKKESRLDHEPVKETGKDEKSDSELVKKKKSDAETVNGAGKEKKSDFKSVNDATKENNSNPKGINEAGKQHPNPSPRTGETVKENKSDPGSLTDETCDGLNPRCNIQNDLTACIKSSNRSKIVVLLQNNAEENLKATVSAGNIHEELEIPKKRSKLLSMSLTGNGVDVVLPDGKGKCVPHLSIPVSEANFMRFPSYDQLVTPVNGVYLVIFTVLIFGGMWACIKFSRRRRQGGGIPYQELEMGLPESVSAADVETAEVWDQGWDDDWDENNAVKSPGGLHVGSISANGLTSRSPIKDGWEDDWDD